MTPRAAFAPAKINLFLHVGAARADGYHPLCSWMTFADLGDAVELAGAEPGLRLEVEGPFAGELTGLEAEDNLVLRAARAVFAAAGRPVPDATLTLCKRLPTAAGLGGGSSDAGAALRLLRAAYGLPLSDAELAAVALGLGSDGPACLWAAPVIAQGRGETLSPAPAAPVLDAVLVNPGVACPTGAVYRAFDAAGRAGGAVRPDLPDAFHDAAGLIRALAACRNDLEAAAVATAPEVGETLSTLREFPECRLARVSGSGATCFALCADAKAAEKLAGEVAAAVPAWWVRACRLGGPPPHP